MAATPNYGWPYPTVGADNDVWGEILNDLFNDVDGDLFALSGVVSGKQDADADLTAIAALGYTSGTYRIVKTAANTWSLVTDGEFTSATAGTAPARMFNTADSASLEALRLEGDRPTPAANDDLSINFYHSDSAGNQDKFVGIAGRASVVTSGAEEGAIVLSAMKAGAFTAFLRIDPVTIRSIFNDTVVLGSTTIGFADYHGASGHQFNMANGDAILTHVPGGFEVTGTLKARTPTSSEASGTLTSASANKVVKATSGITINDGVFTAGDHIEVYNDSDSSITITQDTGMTLRLAGSASTGNRTLARRGIAVIYFDANDDATVGGTGVS